MTVELKACPFCGGKAQIMHTKNVDATKWFVTCLVCGVETPRIARNAAEAYRAWDRRTAAEKQIDTPTLTPTLTPTQTNSAVCELEQIKQMANDLRNAEHWYYDEISCTAELDAQKTAKNLYNMGYRRQSKDMLDIETVKKWLYQIAINNVGYVLDGDFSTACEEIISRLDGLKRFAEEMKGD